jgi:hypothetical protein
MLTRRSSWTRARDPSLAVAVVGAALGLLGILLVATFWVVRERRHNGRVHDSRREVSRLRTAVLLYLGREPGAGCATFDDLRRAGTLDPSQPLTDAWNRPFAIECNGDDIFVLSAGPDGKLGTPDDID